MAGEHHEGNNGEFHVPKEKISGLKVHEFDYAGRHFDVKLIATQAYSADPEAPARYVTRFEIRDDDNAVQGDIIGFLDYGADGKEIIFRSSSLTNQNLFDLHKAIEKLPGHVPGVVRETIAQLISRGLVNTWISTGTVLLEGGIRTYEALLADPRIDGRKAPLPGHMNEPKYMQYTLRAKKNV